MERRDHRLNIVKSKIYGKLQKIMLMQRNNQNYKNLKLKLT